MNNFELVNNLRVLGLTVNSYEPEELLISNNYSASDLEHMLEQLRSPTCPFPRPIHLETIVTSLLEKLQKDDKLPRPFLYTDNDFQRTGIDKAEFCARYQRYMENDLAKSTDENPLEHDTLHIDEEMETVD